MTDGGAPVEDGEVGQVVPDLIEESIASDANRASARIAVQQMLRLADVTRVVSVDDVYSREPEWPPLRSMAITHKLELAAIFPDLPGPTSERPDSTVGADLDDAWDALDQEQRVVAGRALRELDPDQAGEGAAMEVVAALLDNLEGVEFSRVPMRTWREQFAQLARSTGKVLVLFDHDFKNEGLGADAGLDAARSFIGAVPGALCGILLRTNDDHYFWQSQLSQEGLDRDRVVAISKTRLPADPHHFARRLKMTLLSEHCRALRKAAVEILTKSQESAGTALEKNVRLPEFEHIVFRLSLEEGVWEIDTLFRLFGMYAESQAHSLARQDPAVTSLTEQIRAITAIDTPPGGGIKVEAWRVQHTELYQRKQYLQDLCMPIELGDIFEVPASGLQYILVSQPCDLMLRRDGTRRLTVAQLLQIERGRPPITQATFDLPWYDDKNGSVAHVLLGGGIDAPLDVLDLCVLSGDGNAAFVDGTACPAVAIGPLHARHAYLTTVFRCALDAHREVTEVADGNMHASALLRAAESLLPGSGFSGLSLPTVTPHGLEYPLRRVGRLRLDRAGGLLLAANQHDARPAYELDIGRPPKPFGLVPSGGGNTS